MIVQGQTTLFKLNCLSGLENFAAGTPYTYKIALYNALANLDNATTAYSTTNEVTGTGYTAGGQALTITQVPTIGNQTGNATAYMSFQNVTWTSALTARGALIYKSGSGNPTVCVLDFGGDKTSTSTFTVQFPAVTNSSAIIRIA